MEKWADICQTATPLKGRSRRTAAEAMIKMVKNDGAAERRWSDSEGMGASQQRTAI